MIVLGLAGTIGAGKDAVADYLVKKYEFKKITVGDLVREETKRRGMELSRENSVEVSEDMRDKHGKTYWLEKVADRIEKEEWEKVVVSGIRLPSDDNVLHERFGDEYILILVDAKPEIRFERMKSRAREDAPKTLEEFEKQERTEWKLFKLEETFRRAKYTLDNNGDMNELKADIDDLMEQLELDYA
ncbi:MAG: AAA family ATPase [Candidatus Nanoarchaeia archaeon]|nr:AAA family ATPase [Candidatus Nanoarchaeia archaeon]